MNWKALVAGIALCAAWSAAEPATAQQRPSQREATPRTAPSRPTARPAQDNRSAAQRARDRSTSQPGAGSTGDTRFGDVRIHEGPDNGRDELYHRRDAQAEELLFAFNEAEVEQIIPFISEVTGKVVIPVQMQTLRMTKITLVTDTYVPRMKALDMLFTACRLNGIGVIEREDIVILMPIGEMANIGRFQVLDSTQDVMGRADIGNTVIKVFPLLNANAELVGDRILEVLPDATLSVDGNSNQIVMVGDIGLAQQIQRLIDELDKNFIEEETVTYYLKYVDAMEVMDSIFDLFPEDAQQIQQQRAQRGTRPGQRQPQAAQAAQAASIGPVVQLRITPIPHQNALTVTAKPDVVAKITDLIVNKWDLPRSQGTSKVYTLKYTDAIQLSETLRALLGQGSTSGSAGRGAQGRGGGATGGQRSEVSESLSGIYAIQPYAEHNRIMVLSKTEESLAFLDDIIEKLDQRSEVGLPVIIELKHADAVLLAEELNALLQEWGGGANIPAPQQGLTGQSMMGGDSDARGAVGGAAGGRGGAGQQQAGRIRFPWESGQRTDRAPESPIIGQARIMPIVRQNALAIVAPPAHLQTVQDIVEMLDRPGRQVMIAATVAEVRLEDSLALGLRWGAPGSVPAGEGSILGTGDLAATRDPAIGGDLFSSSILDVGVSVDVVLQALERRGGVRILQSPRIFTSDNKEARFFDGSTIPFISSQQQSAFSADSPLINQFDRENVGVQLNVRPRITVHGDIDLELFLELSTVNQPEDPARIRIDRRETTTQVIVKDGQTIVLSGILRDEESSTRRKVPFLGQIPIIGALFTSTDTSVTQTELIAFITPIIVENPSDNDENFNVRERQRLRELSRSLKEQPHEIDEIRERISDPAGTGFTVPERFQQEMAPQPEDDEELFDPVDLMDE